ncbi:hypothetical protein GGR50DRAFT_698659 [Xylaria sp. CBS 124048]|nr:hypothetical protein GGR50DRAFT_698659 [Xylaria sp. CBS 124048]
MHLPRGRLAGNDGELRRSFGQHRTAARRLSCISENQKENSQHSEDDYYAATTQIPKTPVLAPVRCPHPRRRADRESQGSDDGVSVSPFQLDLEQMGTYCPQGTNHSHPMILAGRRAASGRFQTQPGQPDTSVSRPNPPDATSPGFLEVQWRLAPWTSAQAKNIYIEAQRRALPGTGLDGPRSSASGTSPLWLPSDISGTPLGPITLSTCPSCDSQLHGVNTPGPVNSDTGNPQKRHDVSEISEASRPVQIRPSDVPTSFIIGTMDALILEGPGRQFDNTQDDALKSCPEFYRRSLSGVYPAVSKVIAESNNVLKPPNYSQFETARHRHRLHVPDRVSKRFHMLRERLHRCRSSSLHSLRPEFPPPPDGKERRYRSRNSSDIWPSSGEGSPIFNTPESRLSPMKPTDVLATSGLAMTAEALDRFNISANGSVARTSPTLTESVRLSTDTNSPPNESDSSAARIAPSVPANTPSSISPIMRPSRTRLKISKRPGRSRRRRHSRLSEVSVPAQSDRLTRPAGVKASLSLPVCPSNDPLQDTTIGFEAGRHEPMMPRPLSFDLPTSQGDEPNPRAWRGLESIATQIPPTHNGRLSFEGARGLNTGPSESTLPRERVVEPPGGKIGPYNRIDLELNTCDPTILKRRPVATITPPSDPDHSRYLKMRAEKTDSTLEFDSVAPDKSSNEGDPVLEESASASSGHPDTSSSDLGKPRSS